MKDNINKNFKLFARFPKSKSETNSEAATYETNENGSLIIEGIASTTNQDLQFDIVKPDAIEQMKEQAISLNLHHDHIVEDSFEIIGAITEVINTDEDLLKVKAKIRPKFSPEIQEMLDTGINLGLSISGDVTEYDTLKDGGWEINGIDLYEISLTGMPANWDTFGTVTTSKGIVESTCLTGACYQIMKNNQHNKIKNYEEKQMEDNKPIETDEAAQPATKQDVVNLINEDRAKSIEEIKSEILEELTPKIEDIVDNKIKPKDPENPEETKAATDDEKEEEMTDEEKKDEEDLEKAATDDEEEDDMQKSYTLSDIKKMRKSWIEDAKQQFEEEVLKDLSKSREPDSSVKETAAKTKTKQKSNVRKAKISEIAKEWGLV